ncbi:MAG: HpcH/HpaI aldolase/citrate lyase family protein [Christensenellales bacterium]|jgi:citrate lyase subunit beta/citryl-CoA lyase
MRRSLLFIPGNNPGMLMGADIHGADAVIFDLEDAVAPTEKDAARILVRNAMRAMPDLGVEVVVRVNPLATDYFIKDIQTMVPLHPALITPTKVASAEDVAHISAAVAAAEQANGMPEGSIGLLPLLETAQGIENAYAIASCDPRVKGLLLGAEDLSSDLQAIRSKQGDEILYARGRIVMAARAAGIAVYDTPFTDVNDAQGVREDAALARALGFSGKAVISPRHVEAVNDAFTPTQEEIAYAREVMLAIAEARQQGRGAISLRGKMVDKPIVDRAQRVLATAKQLGLEGSDL